jgi:hypothetical protein
MMDNEHKVNDTGPISIPYTVGCPHFSLLVSLCLIKLILGLKYVVLIIKILKLYGRNNTWSRNSKINVVNRLRAGRSRVRFPSFYPKNFQTSSGGPPILLVSEYRGLAPREWSGRSVGLTIRPAQSLRICGAISLLPPYVFMACIRTALLIYFLPPQINVYGSICVEMIRLRTCYLTSPNFMYRDRMGCFLSKPEYQLL